MLRALPNINRKSGYPIVNMGYDTKTPKYCCGSVVDNQCKDGDPFTIGNGAVIPEVAALAGYVKASAITDTTCSNSLSITTSSNSASTAITACPTSTGDNTSPSSHDLAIGVGVGVPLGVIALASIVWALWERRRRLLVNISINIWRTAYINHILRSSRLDKQGRHRSWTATGVQNELDIGSVR
ncbi:hypothetical protein V6Z96_001488 [Aspergillus fumigatus]